MSLIVGEDVRVAASRDAVLLGLTGRIVLESMHTLTIRTENRRKVTMPKAGTALELTNGEILIGDELEGRLEDRIAAGGRLAGRGARRRI